MCKSRYTRAIWYGLNFGPGYLPICIQDSFLIFHSRPIRSLAQLYLPYLRAFEHGVLRKEVTAFSLTVYRATWNARSQEKEGKDNVENEGVRRVGAKSEQVLPIFTLSAYNPYR